MSEQIRRELLSDLKELQKVSIHNEASQIPSFRQPLQTSQLITASYLPSQNVVLPQARIQPPLRTNLVYSQIIPQNIQRSNLAYSQVAYAQPQPLVRSQVIATNIVSPPPPVQVQPISELHESIKGESYVEYVPFEKVYIDHEEVKTTELVNVNKNRTDFYVVEKQVDYIPLTKYETIQDVIPQEKTEVIPQTIIEYVPEVETELVPVERIEEKVVYQPVKKQVIHYPEFDQQFAEDAQKSGRIIKDPSLIPQSVPLQATQPALFGSQVIQPQSARIINEPSLIPQSFPLQATKPALFGSQLIQPAQVYSQPSRIASQSLGLSRSQIIVPSAVSRPLGASQFGHFVPPRTKATVLNHSASAWASRVHSGSAWTSRGFAGSSVIPSHISTSQALPRPGPFFGSNPYLVEGGVDHISLKHHKHHHHEHHHH